MQELCAGRSQAPQSKNVLEGEKHILRTQATVLLQQQLQETTWEALQDLNRFKGSEKMGLLKNKISWLSHILKSSSVYDRAEVGEAWGCDTCKATGEGSPSCKKKKVLENPIPSVMLQNELEKQTKDTLRKKCKTVKFTERKRTLPRMEPSGRTKMTDLKNSKGDAIHAQLEFLNYKDSGRKQIFKDII